MGRRSAAAAVCSALLLVGAARHPAFAQVTFDHLIGTDAAVEALDAGRLDEAARLFGSAAASAPRDPGPHVGLALVRYLQGRYDEARDALRRALEIDDKHAGARLVLGRLQRRTGDLQGAVRTYAALLADHPDLPGLADTLERWNREDDLHSRMQVAIGSHFSVAFEGPAEAALAERAVASLERAYDRVGETLSVFPVSPVMVVLYTGQQFRDITRSPRWAGGAFDGTIRVPIRGALEQGAELDRVLAHEYVHALAATLTRRAVPYWFAEGLAGALEGDDVSWAHAAVGELEAPVPLAALTGPFDGLSPADAQVAYAVSALAVRRLLDEAGGMAAANLLRDVDDGVPFETAFAHRMQRTLAEFEATLR